MTNNRKTAGRILYIGSSYYNNWYLSRSLRKLGWKADVLTYPAEGTDLFSHGADFILKDHVKDTFSYQEKRFDFFFFLFRGQQHPFAKKKTFIGKKIEPFLSKIIPWLIWRLPRPIIRWLLRRFLDSMRQTELPELKPLYDVLTEYDILHFTGVQNLRYFYFFNASLFGSMPIGWDIELLKRFGKKIVYTNTGCLDGVTQSSFRKWKGPEVVCNICPWRDRPDVCSDERNRTWGELRNRVTDYQITLGGNRADFNDDPRVHEVPEFYCLDPDVWHPDLAIPSEFRLPYPKEVVKIFHAVGNYEYRTDNNKRNLKSTHIYIPLIETLKSQGYPVEMIFIHGVPNIQLRFYQAQADIFVDMLTFGFFGATVREGLMLGKPIVCYLRPQWLESMRCEIPEYVEELPVISATPDTVEEVLKDLIMHPEKRAEIGKKSREFALKWHSAEAGARRLSQIYSSLLAK
jgi:glycosyltransferase involved in cell wall biosynthesis